MGDTRIAHHTKAASRPSAVLAALLATVGAYGLMQTLVIPAMSVLAERLHADTATAGWLVTAFLLGGAVLTPVLSLLGDKYGHRRLLLLVMLVFLASTLAAAASPTIGFLIAMRAVQGASMASLPLALALVREAMPRERMASSFGLTAAMLGGGAGVGLVVGALIIQHTSWRWMFGAEAVFIAVATLMVLLWVPESPERHSKRIDVPGALLLAGGLVALLLAITEGTKWGWLSAGVLSLFAVAAVVFAVLGVVSSRRSDPILDLRHVTHLPMLVTNLAALLVGMVPFFFYVLVPQLLQLPSGLPPALRPVASYGAGLTIVQSGLLMLPGSLLVVVGGRTAHWLRGRLGPRAPLFACMTLMTSGAVLTALLHSSPAQVSLWFSLVGLGAGYGYAALADLVAALVPRREIAAGNGLNTVIRTVGSAVGSQLAVGFLQSFTVHGTHVPAEKAFTVGFWVAAVLGVLGILLVGALRIRPHHPAPAPEAVVVARDQVAAHPH
ncbi:MFS transporter [Streptomyces sp. G-G2]|uniref:MFS transporter n=1 Tax=Streptomyces sp. G-G2 TaxID=3046201 RepID=UPI0024BA5EBE|nr:MFS transporter [Streptomyces sp. G-G2]MDJ0382337.1 MFS transporter [Streptomyces sp. G-G2]